MHDAKRGFPLALTFDSNDEEVSFTVHNLEYAEDVDTTVQPSSDWLKRCWGVSHAHVANAPSPRVPAGYLDEVRARCPRKTASADFYDVLWERQYQLAHQFRWVGPILSGEQESICQMRMPTAAAEHEQMAMPPGLIDSCFQLLSATAFEDYKGTTFIPLGVEELFFYGNSATFTTESLWCHTKERRTESRDSLGADVVLFDNDGNVVMRINNLRLKKAGGDAILAMTRARPNKGATGKLAKSVYSMLWAEEALAADAARVADGTWLVFGEDALAAVAKAHLIAQNQQCLQVTNGDAFAVDSNAGSVKLDFTSDAHFGELFNAAFWEFLPPLTGVLFVSAGDVNNGSTADLRSLVSIVQGLGKQKPRVVVATQGAQAVTVNTRVTDSSGAMLWGFLRAAAKERPQLKTLLVDTDAASHDVMCSELMALSTDSEIAFVGGARHAASLANTPLQADDAGVAHPVHLITTERGNIANLKLAPLERREPGATEIEIRVYVTGLNFRDVMNSLGMFGEGVEMPFGGECAGVVTRVGSDVTDFQVGDEVFGLAPGSFATFVITSEHYVTHKPADLSWQEATTIPATFLTAYYGLVHLAKLQKGETVLIHAAAGGVGLAAVQVAKYLGCQIIGTAGSPAKRQFLKDQGVHHVFHSRTTDFQADVMKATLGGGVHVVLNSLTGDFISATMATVMKGGRFIEIGKVGIWTTKEMAAKRADMMYSFFDLVEMWNRDPAFIKSLLNDVMDKLAATDIQPLPVKSFDLPRYEDAIRFMATAKHIGKIVVSHPMPPRPLEVHADAAYLITGGYSGIGLATAVWLAQKGARNLAILSRRAVAPDDALAALKAVSDDVNVICVQGDVGDADAVRVAVETIETRGLTLRGVVHSAGVTNDKALEKLTWADFESVLSCKVQGAWNLHQATLGSPLDFFTTFSSVSGLLGNFGQTSYAAANAYLDGLAHYRHSMGFESLVVNWGPWAEVGMAARMSNAAAMGMTKAMMLTPSDGIKLLELCFMQRGAQFALAPAPFLAKFEETSKSSVTAALRTEWAAAAKSKKKSRGGAGKAAAAAVDDKPYKQLVFDLVKASKNSRPRTLMKFIIAEVARILALPVGSKVNVRMPFTEMGFDSLMAIEFRNSFSAALGAELDSTILFDYPNVEALVAFVLESVVDLEASAAVIAEYEATRKDAAADDGVAGDAIGASGAAADDDATDVAAVGAAPAAAAASVAVPTTVASDHEPIAVIGIGVRMPGGSDTPDAYWNMLMSGTDCISEVPASRWSLDEYYSDDQTEKGKMNSKYGGFLSEPVDMFDNVVFGISPREAERMDPQQRLLLECTWEALERAGYCQQKLTGQPVGVYVGMCSTDYQMLQMMTGNVDMIDAYYGTGNAVSCAAGRLSYVMNFQGPNLTTDTACSSSLVATHMAVTSLRTRQCDMALSAGVNLLLAPILSINFSQAGMLAPGGRCKTFDASADGYVRGEGCGVIVLKRLSDAIAAHDNLIAVIKGSAINHDGRSSGLTVPNGPAQQACLRSAMANARVEPADYTYFETHGTGTSLGDLIELGSLTGVIGKRSGNPLTIGSIKTNIGHLEGAAGIAGLMKIILATQSGSTPPHLHLKTPHEILRKNPSLEVADGSNSCVALPGKQRLAGVSSFGFGGTNAHIVVEQAPDRVRPTARASRAYHLFNLSAVTTNGVVANAEKFMRHVETHSDDSLLDMCYTLNIGRQHMRSRLAVTAADTDGLVKQLKTFVDTKKSSAGVVYNILEETMAPPVAFVFTGQGSQYVNMGKDLYDTQPMFKATIDQCAELLKEHMDTPLLDIMFPSKETTPPLIDSTQYAQPALFAIEYSLAQLWLSWGVTPAVVMGHSVGEVVAACVAGVFSLADGLKLIAARGRLMGACPRGGGMVAVFTKESDVKKAIASYKNDVSIAAINGPKMVVISGKTGALDAIAASMKAKSVKTSKLNVSHAFHSASMDSCLEAFRAVAETIEICEPKFEVISNLTGKICDALMDAAYWVKHLRGSVRFADAVDEVRDIGCTVWIEMGPNPVLLDMAKRCMDKEEAAEYAFVPSLRKNAPADRAIVDAAAAAFTNGVEIDFDAFNADLGAYRVVLPTYAFQKQRFWLQGIGKRRAGASSQAVTPQMLALDKAVTPYLEPNLIGQRLKTPFLTETIFVSQLSVVSFPVILDHVINDLIIVPAVFYVAFVLEAARKLGGMGPIVLSKVMVPGAVLLETVKASKQTQLVCTPKDNADGEFSWTLYSFKPGFDSSSDENPDAWMVNAQGDVAPQNAASNNVTMGVDEPIADIKARCTKEMTKKEFYDIMWSRNYALGTMFQLIEHIWLCPANIEGICELRNEIAAETDQYQLYPVYFDCCIQIIVAIVSDWIKEGSSPVTYLPVGIDKFIFYQTPRPGTRLWCHTKLAEGSNLDMPTLVADMSVCDDDGNMMAQAIGFRVGRASREQLLQSLQEDVSGLMYEMAWQPTPALEAPEEEEEEEKGAWLIISDKVVAPKVAADLSKRGYTPVVVTAQPGASYAVDNAALTATLDATDETHFAQLLQEEELWSKAGDLAGVVHLGSLDGTTALYPSSAELAAAQDIGVRSALGLVHALAAQKSGARLYLVSQGTQAVAPVDGADDVAIASAPVWGFGKVVALEAPRLRCVRVDLPLVVDDETASLFVDELVANAADDEVGFRGGERFVERLVNKKKGKAAATTIREEASYIITGGFGGLGLLVAKWLVDKGAKDLTLVGRRAKYESADAQIEELEARGVTVRRMQADVSVEADVARLIADVSNESPIGGIMHAAGFLDDKKLSEQNWQSFESVMASKVAAARHLHEAAKEMTLDFFVLFSSASSAIGNMGQANYAAANAFMDSLAHARRAAGLTALSINWGPWSEVGMAANLKFEGGLRAITPSRGLNVLGQAMDMANQSQIISAVVDWMAFLQPFGKNIPPIFTDIAAKELGSKKRGATKKKSASGDTALSKKMAKLPAAKRKGVLIEDIRTTVMRVLGATDPEVVQAKQALSELGLDSLMATELRNELTDLVGAELPGTLLFDYPTIDAISEYIMDEVLQLTDAVGGDEAAAGMTTEQLERMRSDPVAIVGMSCRMPGGGDDPDKFWANLIAGKNCVSVVPADRWDHSLIYDTDPDVPGKAFVDRAGFLTCDIKQFDGAFFGISPREAAEMDPQQRMLLECTWEALETGGMAPNSLAGTRTGVFMGICGYDYTLLGANAGDLTGIVGYTGTGVAWSVAAGRISYTLGFKGPAFTLDTACSSASIAIHQACMSLKSGETNMCVAGGVNLLLAPDLFVNFSKAKMLSPNGRCATFDADGDGFCRGEGASVVVLKRLSDATKDGDVIQALVLGSATNQDGRSNSLTAPNGPSQQSCIRDALNMGGVDPLDVTYAEAHGTGTSLCDPIEVGALAGVYGKGREEDNVLVIGSVKSVIGHLEASAGISGLTKVLMMMRHEKIPPNLHFNNCNPMIDFKSIPAIVPVEVLPWKGNAAGKHVACISSFGFGGSNCHMVVQKYVPPPVEASTAPERVGEIFVLSAKCVQSLKDTAQRYVDFLASTDASLADVCYTAACGRSHFVHRLAVTCTTKDELSAALANYIADKPTSAVSTGRASEKKVAFLFTGQGSQYVNMGKELYDTQPVFKQSLDQCAELLKEHMSVPLLDVLFPAVAGDTPQVDDTEFAQPAIFAVEYSLAKCWEAWGVTPAALLGHSVGELVAACVSGSFSLEDGLKLIAARAKLMASAPRDGGMLAVFAGIDVVTKLVEAHSDELSLAAHNGPALVVVSGKSAALTKVEAAAKAQGVKAKALNVSHAFHSQSMDSILPAFKKIAKSIEFDDGFITLVSNATGAVLDKTLSAEYFTKHIRDCVQFAPSIATLRSLGCDAYVEIGPNPTLSGMAARIPFEGKTQPLYLPSLRGAGKDAATLASTLSQMYVKGVELDWNGYYAPHGLQKVIAPTYAFLDTKYWSDRAAAGQARINNGYVTPGAGGAAGAPAGALLQPCASPLLSGRIRSPNATDISFATTVSTKSLPLLKDHVVYDTVVMPFVFGVSMALDALSQLEVDSMSELQAATVRRLEVQQPLGFANADDVVLMQTNLQRVDANDEFAVTISHLESTGDAASTWAVHSAGAVTATVDVPQPAATPIDTLRAELTTEVDAADFYADFADAGIAYGGKFQLVEQVWVGETAALARLTVPSASQRAGYTFYPVFLDCALQTISAQVQHRGDVSSLYLPAAADNLRFFALNSDIDGMEHVYAHVTYLSAGKRTLTFRVRLLAPDGTVLAEIEEMTLAEMSRSLLKAALRLPADDDASGVDPLYEVEWTPQTLSEGAAGDAGSSSGGGDDTWVVLADAAHAMTAPLLSEASKKNVSVVTVNAGAVGAAFAKDGATVTMDPANAAHYAQLLADAGVAAASNIVHLWSLDASAKATVDIDASETRGVHSALLLAQALKASAAAPRVWFATAGCAPVSNSDAAAAAATFAQSPVWGLARVLALEAPKLRCSLVDVDGDAAAAPRAAALLFAEVAASTPETQVALRGAAAAGSDDRFVARLVQSSLARSTDGGNADVELRQRLVINKRGAIKNLETSVVARDAPGDGQVEVNVRATGVNFRDVMDTLGMYPGENPFLGLEGSGVIVRVGDNVTGFKVGDAVFGLLPDSFSSHSTVDATLLAHKPDNITFAEAATIPVTFITAYHALVNIAKLRTGERILIHAASGGVGMAATQIALNLGCEVWGTASAAKQARVKEAGVHHVMDSRSLAFSEQTLTDTRSKGVHVVLNSLNGDFIPKSLDTLTKTGRFVEIGKAGKWSPQQVADYRDDVDYVDFDLFEVTRTERPVVAQILAQVSKDLGAGKLKPLPNATYALGDVGNAFRLMAQAKHIGKIVVTQPASSAKAAPAVVGDACYLVTGALGGLGQATCAALVARGARHLVLCGRKPTDADAVVDALAAIRTQAKKATGDVVVDYVQADVSSRGDVDKCMTHIGACGKPLRGVFHLAGVLRDAMLDDVTWESFETVFAPKVRGALHLHDATVAAACELDFFCLFSSMSALLGNIGQANYAAANAFLDSLAAHRRANGLAATAVNWGPFSDVGMAADIANDAAVTGVEKLSPRAGMRLLFDRILLVSPSLRRSAQVLALPLRWRAFLATVKGMTQGAVPPFYAVMQAAAGGDAGAGDYPLVKTVTPLAADDRAAAVVTYLTVLVKSIMGLADNFVIDDDMPLAEVGLDSLMSMELANTVRQDSGCLLTPAVLQDYPDLTSLSAYIVRMMNVDGGAGGATRVVAAVDMSRQPVFAVQGIGRGDAMFGEIAAGLPETHRLVEMTHVQHEYASIEELAAPLVAEIQQQQPAGSVALLGYSFGGGVAYEMTRQLRAAGRDVAHLFLVDWVDRSMSADGSEDTDIEVGALGALVRSVELLKKTKLAAVDMDALRAMPFDAKFDFVMEKLYDSGMVPRSVPSRDFRASAMQFITALKCLHAYEHGASINTCPVPTQAFRAMQLGLYKMNLYDWEKVQTSRSTTLAVTDVECDHWEILKGDHAAQVCAVLSKALA
jgi:acyl transferase domain-containing protein/NADPH:quinone reductase-like Zn-dependent oxidoreductase/thioesterase domain-containing protein/acyl carrier protein